MRSKALLAVTVFILGAFYFDSAHALQITSTSFGNNDYIPIKHTADGSDVSPPLKWANAPTGTVTFVIIMEDADTVDALGTGRFTHWMVYNLPATTMELGEGVPKSNPLTGGGQQGTNDFNAIGYNGPKVPAGEPEHHYHFIIYALNSYITLEDGATRAQLNAALGDHVLAETRIVGLYPPNVGYGHYTVTGELAITRVVVTPFYPTQGNEVRIVVTVENIGDKDLPTFNVSLWKDRKFQPFVNLDRDASQLVVGGLAVGATAELTFRVAYENPGLYTYWLMADSDRIISELNERDNLYSALLEIHPSLPDLRVFDFKHAPEPPTPGGLLTFSVVVQNNGAAATGPFTVAFFANRFTPPTLADVSTASATAVVANLDPAGTMDNLGNFTDRVTLPFPIIAPDPLRGFTAWVFVDSANTVVEYDENNNTGKDVWGAKNDPVAIASALTGSTAQAGLNELMTFSVIAYDPENDALGYFWDFGDGTPVTLGGPTATHAFGAPGFYTVTVTVVDGPFSSVVSTFQINVLNQPVVNLGVVPVKRNKAKLLLPLPSGMFRTDRVLSTVKDVKTGINRMRVRVDKAVIDVSGPGTYRFEVEFLARKTKQLNRTIFLFTVE